MGKKRFTIDTWGDTVNVASRMEQAREVGKINVSKQTYRSIEYHFNVQSSGLIKVKGNGEMEMFLVR